MLLPLPATSALADLSRRSYPHETAKNLQTFRSIPEQEQFEVVFRKSLQMSPCLKGKEHPVEGEPKTSRSVQAELIFGSSARLRNDGDYRMARVAPRGDFQPRKRKPGARNSEEAIE